MEHEEEEAPRKVVVGSVEAALGVQERVVGEQSNRGLV